MNIKKILHFSIGPILTAFLGLITLPILTWYFNQEDIGRLSMYQITISLSIFFFSFGLDQAYVREYHETKEKSVLFKTVLLPPLFFLIVILFISYFFAEKISLLIFEIENSEITLILFFGIILMFIVHFLYLILRMKENGIAYSISQVFPKIFFLLLILFIFNYLEKDFHNLLVANIISVFASLVLLTIYTKKEFLSIIHVKIDFVYLQNMLKYSIPLMLGSLIFWALSVIDRIFIKEYSSLEELAIYSVAISFAAVGVILQNIFSTIWAPTVYKWAANNENLDKINSVIFYIMFLVGLIFCLAGIFSWVITILLPENYHFVQYLLVISLANPLFLVMSEATVVGVNIARKSNYILIASAIAFIFNLFGNYLLVPKFGVSGAAISTAISFFILFVLKTEFSILVWGHIPRLKIYSVSITFLIASILFVLFGDEYHSISILIWALLFILQFIIFKKESNEILEKLQIKFKRVG